MSRSLIHLRRVLGGVSCTIVFGFGATEAFAERTNPPSSGTLCEYGDVSSDMDCQARCGSINYGWCSSSGVCRCSEWGPFEP